MMLYTIFELTPIPSSKCSYRFVEAFENIEDATIVLNALESVNILSAWYKILTNEEVTKLGLDGDLILWKDAK